ncbi:MAG TPA: hypothetical protein DCY79_13640, partial [Planctomycetaceae bacterium]|nr:hypothetical protein [Planctomycetaceae bacterium]
MQTGRGCCQPRKVRSPFAICWQLLWERLLHTNRRPLLGKKQKSHWRPQSRLPVLRSNRWLSGGVPMAENARFRTLVYSVVKHDYIPLAVAAHPRFDLVAVADEPDQPEWVHQRNQEFADRFQIPYVRDFAGALQTYEPTVAVVSSQAERHCELAVRATDAGLHVIVDKPLSTRLSECDRLVAAVEAAGT